MAQEPLSHHSVLDLAVLLCQTLRPSVDGEQWVDRATDAIMESIRCFKKWRKEAEMAGVEHKPLQPEKKDGECLLFRG